MRSLARPDCSFHSLSSFVCCCAMMQPPFAPPKLTVVPSPGEPEAKRSKSRAKPKHAGRTEREQDLLDLLKAMKRSNRLTAEAISTVVERVARSPGSTLVQAICRVVDFANKNNRAR